MTFISNKDFLIEVAKGNVPGHSLFHQIGTNSMVGTAIVPITNTGLFPTPTVAVTLEVLSSETEDTDGGGGAHTVVVSGIDATGSRVSEIVTMNGTTPVSVAGTWLRVDTFSVGSSGSYATQSVSSHVGTLTLRVESGGATWSTIDLKGGFGLGQSQIGVFTVPTGVTAYLLSLGYSVDSNKAVSLFILARTEILDVTTPYSPMQLQALLEGIQGTGQFQQFAIAAFPEETDIGVMASTVSGNAAVSIDLELLLVANTL